ncbi:MAG: type II secretion system F family protein [Ktedonobacterales bacterium]
MTDIVSALGVSIPGMPMITLEGLLIGALVTFAILALFVGLQRIVFNRPNTLAKRLGAIGVAPATAESTAAGAGDGHGLRQGITNVAEGAATRNFTEHMARELAQADLKLTVGEFLVLSGVLASVGALLGLALPISGRFVLALLLLLTGAYGPRVYVARRKLARLRMFNAQLPDMINLMTSALQTGFALPQAFAVVAREGPKPSASEFDRVGREIDLGLSVDDALANLLKRMPSDDLDLFITAINVQREVGGNLVEVFDTIANTIRERIKLLGDVRVLTAQQQLSGYVIASLPIGLALLLTLINPTYMLGVFETTRWCGWTMVGCGSGMIFLGFLIIRRIVNIQV